MAATHPSTLRRPAVGFQDVQAILIIAPNRVDSCRRRHDGLCKAPGRGRLMMIRDPGVSKGRRRIPRPALLGHLTLRPPARPPAKPGRVIAFYLNRGIAYSNIGIYTDGMKLSAWAKANGLAYQTAWRLWRAGKLPIAAEQLPTGTVIVHPPKASTVESVAIDARVSSAAQKGDLQRLCLTRAPDGHPLSVRDWVRFEWSPGEDHAPAVGPRRANHRCRAPRSVGSIRFGVHRGGARSLWAQAR